MYAIWNVSIKNSNSDDWCRLSEADTQPLLLIRRVGVFGYLSQKQGKNQKLALGTRLIS